MTQEDIYTQWPGSRFADERDAEPVAPLQPSQTEVLAAALSQALYAEPQFAYMIPDEQARLRLLPAFFCSIIRATGSKRTIYAIQRVDAGAVWAGPASGSPFGGILRLGLPTIPLQWGWANLRRCITLEAHLDRVHQRLVRGSHWHLLALWREPSQEERTADETLVQPLLARADSDNLPCYVESFNERNLPFYERHGFRIAGSGKIPRGGPDFWAMIRPPRR